MNQRKRKNTLWYSLVLAVLLCIAALVIATGTSFARYRAEREKEATFSVEPFARIFLGVVRAVTEEEAAAMGVASEAEVFDATLTPGWETTGDVQQLTLSVANGRSSSEYAEMDQMITLQIVGTLGLWNGEGVENIYLRLPAENELGYEDVLAMVSQIEPGSNLHTTYGDGWIYSFQNAEGEELCWKLPGGEFSYVTLTVIMKNAASTSASSLTSLVTAE